MREGITPKGSRFLLCQLSKTDKVFPKYPPQQRVRERAGVLPNIAKVQSLRPKTMERGFDLYCQVMDDPTGIGRRERVLIATVVSNVNGCLS
jgi:alkylhydroperoxidase family enzyme